MEGAKKIIQQSPELKKRLGRAWDYPGKATHRNTVGIDWRHAYHMTALQRYRKLVEEHDPYFAINHRKLWDRAYRHAERVANRAINQHNAKQEH